MSRPTKWIGWTSWSAITVCAVLLGGACSEEGPEETASFSCGRGFDAKMDGFRFRSAQELDAFERHGCTDAAGEVLMVYYVPGAENLGPLHALSRVDSLLEIGYASDLRSLDGLENLERLGNLSLIANPELEDISALSSLRSSGSEPPTKSIYIADNDHLTNLDGLGGIERLVGVLIIEENDALTSLDGLDGLESFAQTSYDTQIIIRNNPKLPTCEAEAFAAGIDGVDEVIIAGNDDAASCD